MTRLHLLCPLLLALVFTVVAARADENFAVSAELVRPEPVAPPQLRVSFQVAPFHHLYADMMETRVPEGVELVPRDIPKGEMEPDVLGGTGEDREIFKHDVAFLYDVKGLGDKPLELTVGYQGCSEFICFLPQRVPFTLSAQAEASSPAPEPTPKDEPPTEPPPPSDWQSLAAGFDIVGSKAGYLEAPEFLTFLGRARPGAQVQDQRSWLQSRIDSLPELGLWLGIAVILVGGLLLNLTPCVLPMIPINLAIIGAGAQAASRLRGFILGSAYGGGIAFTYGLLGLLVVLGGATFGALNASPWFNLVIAVLFVFLALAMFGVFAIDFTRFRAPSTGERWRKGSLLAPFVIGCVSALLAGACVAPVLIAVLLLSGNLYAQGHQATGLALPFLLGLGMALPWPFAGAGLSLLPKPGRWMERVKQGFGVFILLFALYYGHLAWTLFAGRTSAGEARELAAAQALTASEEGWLTSLPKGLADAAAQDKPLFIDFWATWCKNCLVMDKTTFKEPEVREALDDFVRLKFQAEDPFDPETKAIQDYFQVLGLPTYVILLPKDRPTLP